MHLLPGPPPLTGEGASQRGREAVSIMATPVHRNTVSFLRKLRYYLDAALHMRIVIDMAIVTLHRGKGYHAVIPASAGPPRRNENDTSYLLRVRRYCGLWLSIRKRLGFRDGCFFRSAVTCRALRRAGIDARLNFGTMKNDEAEENDWHFTGHCWVSCGSDTIETAYPFVIQYPSEGTV